MPVAAEPRRARPGTDPARKGVSLKAQGPKTRTAATTDARRRAAKETVAARPRPSTARKLPTWAELGAGTTAPTAASRSPRFGVLDAVPSLRLAAWALVACAGVTLYVGHVYATRATLAALQDARRENLRLHLTEERLRGAFDRMTGPAVVLDRAATLGLEEGVAYGVPIRMGE